MATSDEGDGMNHPAWWLLGTCTSLSISQWIGDAAARHQWARLATSRGYQ